MRNFGADGDEILAFSIEIRRGVCQKCGFLKARVGYQYPAPDLKKLFYKLGMTMTK